MTTSCPCNHEKKERRRLFRRFFSFIRWATPGVVLALIPKCPVCLAGYIAVATGFGVSITTAKYLRWGLILLCCISLIYFLAKRLPVFLSPRKNNTGPLP
ncbi:hypothetical protein [Chitinophaga sp. Cy-1792]|uniref:hypothetical protein n=1 Tax=Chitinophaga sp. Cy-1792 TaxID=2608339 RepID=UPI00141E49CB|nr:hypothetical protein [Chitinophaga sp. Cy-1792]NIG56030.1 hypothetical protein [Chitinophaga sp. Cy-1792]